MSFSVCASVYFNDQLEFPACEVCKVLSNGELPHEFETTKLAVAQM